jgi:hypothetical protein
MKKLTKGVFFWNHHSSSRASRCVMLLSPHLGALFVGKDEHSL